MVTLVLGGVRSGKSRYAQVLAERAAKVVFVATAEAREDVEMRAKIARHRADRPATWSTVEEPVGLGGVVSAAEADADVILIDCLTLFAANLLERYGEEATAECTEIGELCSSVLAARCTVVLVSNEVGSGVVPEHVLGRRFRDLLGEVNQRVAALAHNVVYMVAGLPMVLKGNLP